MPEKVLQTPYPLIDIDPHFTRVVRYFRASDYATWAVATLAVPGALLAWGSSLFNQSIRVYPDLEISEIIDPDLARIRRVTLAPGDKVPAGRLALGNPIEIAARRMVTGMKVGALVGFCGGFLLAYQNSSSEFPASFFQHSSPSY